jgi:hypothetical protein
VFGDLHQVSTETQPHRPDGRLLLFNWRDSCGSLLVFTENNGFEAADPARMHPLKIHLDYGTGLFAHCFFSCLQSLQRFSRPLSSLVRSQLIP